MQQEATVSLPTFPEIPKGRAGMWWLIAGELIIFGGAVCIYLLYRFRNPDWAELAAKTSTPLGAFNTVVLLTSSLTVVLAHVAATGKNYKKAASLIGVTAALGLVFLAVKGIEYSNEISHGYTLVSHLFFSFYFLLTGLHALHVLAGVVALLCILPGVRNGRYFWRAELVGMYWHFVDIIWIFLFPLLYIAR